MPVSDIGPIPALHCYPVRRFRSRALAARALVKLAMAAVNAFRSSRMPVKSKLQLLVGESERIDVQIADAEPCATEGPWNLARGAAGFLGATLVLGFVQADATTRVAVPWRPVAYPERITRRSP